MSAASVSRVRNGGAAIAERLERLHVRRALVILIALQLAQAAFFAFHTPHNGWVWYSGGDATSYWTEEWALGHLIIPQAVVGYGLPVFYAWVPLVAGPSLLTGLSVITILQFVVLVPLALILFWAVADRLFGRVFAWFASVLWLAGPLFLLAAFTPDYHWVFDQLFLAPHWFGLTNMADLPSLVAVLACALFTLRAVDRLSQTDAAIGGLLCGLALAIKPSNAFFVAAAAVLLVGTRHHRLTALWSAGLLPSLVTLALWKFRGLGYLPLTSSSYEHLRVAAAAGAPLAFSSSKYVPFDVSHFHEELINLREVFFSLRSIEVLVIAGAFGLIRKAPLRGSFVVVWFASYGIIKASSSQSDFPSATYERLVEPAAPALALLALGIVFCLPRLSARLHKVQPAAEERLDLRRLAPWAIVLGLIPLMLVCIAQPASAMRIVRDANVVQEAPLTHSLDVTATRNRDTSVTIRWGTPKLGRTKPWYLVYTSPVSNGCSPPTSGALECMLDMPTLVVTQAHMFVDRPGPKKHYYRVALLASYKADDAGGDLMLVSHGVYVPAVTGR